MLLDLNADIDNKRAGFRLQRLEVLNWGTFDEHIWSIDPNGQNALLTGDIGSGKSTLVDALTTLLVPHQKITYNKAAGAESRERTLLSYVRGAYKNEKVSQSGKARDVHLRSGSEHFTVLLAVFLNEGYGQSATLAQVFWLQQETVKKFYVLAQNEMSILKDFRNFGGQIKRLKKKLRQRPQTELFDTNYAYSDRFRQIFGIRQPEALDLFYQTVSMKSVGNLTDFVRNQMLGKTDIQGRIDELVSRYSELTEAYRAVQRAREQVEMLSPLIGEADQLETTNGKIAVLDAVLEELPLCFAQHRLRALQERLQQLQQQWRHNESEAVALTAGIKELREDLSRLQTARAGLSVNRQLERLRLEMEQKQTEKAQRQQQAAAYREACLRLSETFAKTEMPDLSVPDTADQFLRQQQWIDQALDELEQIVDQVREQLPPLHVRIGRRREKVTELETELQSLRERPTQIPKRHIELRARLLQALRLDTRELPFAGELLQVREEQEDWRGAIERQLHQLGLSLLVPDRHYRAVSDYVDRHDLGGKLVYLRTLEHRRKSEDEPAADSLVSKLKIRADTEFFQWLETELRRRYDYTCCDNMEAFRRAARAITRNGQSKSGRISHVKDDRFDINDRRRHVLGWSNKEKIAALERHLKEETTALKAAEAELADLRQRETRNTRRRDALLRLSQFDSFEMLNYQPLVIRIQQLTDEQRRLASESQELRELQDRIETLEQRIASAEQQRSKLNAKQGAMQSESLRAAQSIYELLEVLNMAQPPIERDDDGLPADMTALYRQFLALNLPTTEPSVELAERLPELDTATTPEALEKIERDLIKAISSKGGEMDRHREQVKQLERSISVKMSQFRNRYPDETQEIDADPRSIPEFRDFHARLLQDDIPRHEERFKDLLRQGTIRSMLSFKSKLEDFEQDIVEKIARINAHLREIDYNPGTYICIAKEEVRTEDILTFKQDLRACTSYVYSDEADVYTEEKFFQVKKLLDRFRGETEEDSRWTQRVSDVREWYTFGVEERWRENDEPHEYFSDSSGKSGGQKEKLAYTILASAIAFQFGLEWGRSRDRSFRFVVIDEAFGRGSDESTRYGLQLFDRLNLQLLIVTPLQKINVIEDYINAVHYVSNPTGQRSMVRNISKAEYLQEKAKRFAEQRSDS